MNIIDAMKAVKEGKHIKRKGWYHMHYIYYDGNDRQNIVFGQKLTEDLQIERDRVFNSRKSLAQYLDEWNVTLNLDDYLANDWEVLEG